MQKIKAKARESRQFDYFCEKNSFFKQNHTDSVCSDKTDKNSLVDVIKGISNLTITANSKQPNYMNVKLSDSSLSTKLDLSQKHLTLYKIKWDLKWILEIPKFVDQHVLTAINEEIRMKLFNWLMEIFIRYKLQKHAYFRTIMVFDIFCQNIKRNIEDNEVMLWGLTALFISVKYEEEEYKLNLEKLVEFSCDQLTINHFLEAEEYMFKTIGFNISFPTWLDVLEELMLRSNIFYEKLDKLRGFAEAILIRCLLNIEMINDRADLLCSSVLIYTVNLFHQHYRIFLKSKDQALNEHTLSYQEAVFIDSIAKVTKLNKAMMESVRERVEEMLERFEEFNQRGELNNIASLADLESF